MKTKLLGRKMVFWKVPQAFTCALGMWGVLAYSQNPPMQTRSLAPAASRTFFVVKDGRLAEHSRTEGRSWKEAGGLVRGGGLGQKLALDPPVLGASFEVEAELTLETTGHTAAGIYFGNEFFGFDGPDGTFFTEGGNFGTSKPIPGSGLIRPGREFLFKAVCAGGDITFYIDGDRIVRVPYRADVVEDIALRPHRGKMTVRNFRIIGTVAHIEPLAFLFACGNGGYASYRIPALVCTTKGTLLAFAEGRKHGAGDHGDIDIVMKRSTDHGKTWSDLQVVEDYGAHCAGNPCPMVDRKTGRVFLLSCTSDTSEGAIMNGDGRRAIRLQYSDDDGLTWTKPRDITGGLYPDNWRWYATGPCSGIQIQEGKYKGRLVAPANHSVFENGANIYRSHCLYSDDGGETWKLGEPSGPGGNESQIAEAGDGLLYQNMRMQANGNGMRGVRYSKDGGETWTALTLDPALKCPVCQGSVIRDYSAPHRLIFSNPAGGGRNGMAIRVSEDGGKTWPCSKPVLKSSSAYSGLAITADGHVAILYEGGRRDYTAEGIVFRLFSKNELFQCEATVPVAKMDWPLWVERFNDFNAQTKQGDIDLVLLGDSITHYWRNNTMCAVDRQPVWDKYFSGIKAANFGLGSDRTQHLLYRLLHALEWTL